MFKVLGWTATVGISFYGGVLYCGWYLYDLPPGTTEKVILFAKAVKKFAEVF